MPRVLLLLPTTTYRTKAFLDAALRMGVDVVAAAERPSTVVVINPAGPVTLHLSRADPAAREAKEFSASHPVDAVIRVADDTAVVAASVARALSLEHNSVESTL